MSFDLGEIIAMFLNVSVSFSEIVALLIICVPIAILTIWGAKDGNKNR